MRLRGLLNEKLNVHVKQQILQLPVATVASLFQTHRTGDKPEDVRGAWLDFLNTQKGLVYSGWKGAAKDFWDFYKDGGFGHGAKLKKESKDEPEVNRMKRVFYNEKKVLTESRRVLQKWSILEGIPLVDLESDEAFQIWMDMGANPHEMKLEKHDAGGTTISWHPHGKVDFYDAVKALQKHKCEQFWMHSGKLYMKFRHGDFPEKRPADWDGAPSGKKQFYR